MVYIKFLVDKVKNRPSVKTLNKSRGLIFGIILCLIFAIFLFNVFQSDAFHDAMFAKMPENTVVVPVEQPQLGCMIGEVWVSINIYDEDGITYRGDDYNIQIYQNDVLRWTDTTRFVAGPRDIITFTAIPNDPEYENIYQRIVIECKSSLTYHIIAIKKPEEASIVMTDYNMNYYKK